MILESIPFSKISRQEITNLIEIGTSENKKLDFKSELPGNSDKEKKNFLSDICAFSNASGGFIIYGIIEEAGKAKSLPGIKNRNTDIEILRLENIIQNGISPRISGIKIRAIDITSDAFVVIIKIPTSWALPHMVVFDGASKFYSRNSAGNYQLDIQEIRAAFAASENLQTSVTNFRLNRVGKIIAGETPIPIERNAKLIIHLIPINAFYDQLSIDLSKISQDYQLLKTIWYDIYGSRINLDGFVTFSKSAEQFVSYTQLFRNGTIEAVHDDILVSVVEDRPEIPNPIFEEIIIKACRDLLDFQNNIGIEPPILIYVTLVGVKGFSMAISHQMQYRNRHQIGMQVIDRDSLLIPEVFIQDYESLDMGRLLRPIFDIIWNAAGWPYSLNYDIDGNRVDK
jgi:hypothetical protein